MINWNTDIESAKQAGWILICVDDEKRWVGLSCWLPDEKRWNMIATTQVPHCWTEINHPLSDEPFVKPMGINTASPPAMTAQQTAPTMLPPGVNVTLPPGM